LPNSLSHCFHCFHFFPSAILASHSLRTPHYVLVDGANAHRFHRLSYGSTVCATSGNESGFGLTSRVLPLLRDRLQHEGNRRVFAKLGVFTLLMLCAPLAVFYAANTFFVPGAFVVLEMRRAGVVVCVAGRDLSIFRGSHSWRRV